jgi:general secretion pathway protein E
MPMAPELAAAAPLLRERDEAVQRLRIEAFARGNPDPSGLVDELLAAAWRAGASDIHLLPLADGTRVSFRVRGALREVAELGGGVHGDMVRRIKTLAGLKPYQQHQPQDGRMRLELREGPRDVRVSVLPTQHGENVVLRLGGAAGQRPLDELGLLEPERRRLGELLAQPQGLIVLCGPTGSGKTTSLYSALAHLQAQRGGKASFATIEDPIELELPFAAQTQVDHGRGLSFAAALRSVLRQDPNILLIGEIRDTESAGIAVQAGLAGHLILTSLHADSALSVMPRLIDLGVERFLVASSVIGVVAQRQVDRLCPRCRRPAPPSREQMARLRALDLLATPPPPFYTADGCVACDGRGSDGRRALLEVLTVGPELRQQIVVQASPDRLRALARKSGWRSLVEIGVDLAVQGEIALDAALGLSAEGRP